MISAFFPPTRQFPGRLGWVILPLLASALSALAATPASPVTTVPIPPQLLSGSKYFYNIDLDPRYQFIGTGELTEEAAQQSNCYRFMYNGEGRLEQIEYRRAGRAMADSTFGVARIDLEYEPGIERRWFHNRRSEPAKDIDGVYGEELTLNAETLDSPEMSRHIMDCHRRLAELDGPQKLIFEKIANQLATELSRQG